MAGTAIASGLVLHLIGMTREAHVASRGEGEDSAVGVATGAGTSKVDLLPTVGRVAVVAGATLTRRLVMIRVTAAALRRRRERHRRRMTVYACDGCVDRMTKWERPRVRHGRRRSHLDHLRPFRQRRALVTLKTRGWSVAQLVHGGLVMTLLTIPYRPQRDVAVRRSGGAMAVRAYEAAVRGMREQNRVPTNRRLRREE